MRTAALSAGTNGSVVPVSVFVNLSMELGLQPVCESATVESHVNMRPMKRLLALILLATLGLEGQAKPPQFTIKVGVDLVNVPFTVTDRRGRLQPGLTASDFMIEED